MKLKILTIIFLVSCLLLSYNQALAIGIGASQSSLDLELELGQPKEIKISVYNTSEDAGIFQVFPDGLKDWIEIKPNNFRLEAGENKELIIKISADKKGVETTNLSILASALDHSSFRISSGLKIPLRLKIEGGRESFLASILTTFNKNPIWVFIAILILPLIVFLKKIFKEKAENNFSQS